MTRGDEYPPAKILIACSQNTVRSPMAAGLMNHYFGHLSTIKSCGVYPADEVNGFASAVMTELGIDISAHKPHTFEDLAEEKFDLVISLTPEAHHQATELTRDGAVEIEYWPTIDPTLTTGNREQILEAFRQVRDTLWKRIKSRFKTPAAPII